MSEPKETERHGSPDALVEIIRGAWRPEAVDAAAFDARLRRRLLRGTAARWWPGLAVAATAGGFALYVGRGPGTPAPARPPVVSVDASAGAPTGAPIAEATLESGEGERLLAWLDPVGRAPAVPLPEDYEVLGALLDEP